LPKNNKYETYSKEIMFGGHFFEKGGKVQSQFRHHHGVRNICRMIDYKSDNNDNWIFFEVCGVSLGTLLYDFTSETIRGTKYYKIIP
jgi:hypothetical protein